VTELDASTGALVKTISGSASDWDYPVAMLIDGRHLFVANSGGPVTSPGPNFVAEFDTSTGALVRTVPSQGVPGPDGIDQPYALAVSGPYLFVGNGGYTNANLNTVAEVQISTGKVVRVLSGGQYDFDSPFALAVSGPDLFVANMNGGYGNHGSVTEVDISTGAPVRYITGPAYHFNSPSSLAVAGPHLFVADYGADPFNAAQLGAVTELDISTGALVKYLSGPAYHFANPQSLAISGSYLLVSNIDGGSLTCLEASSAAFVAVFSGTKYHLDLPSALAVIGSDVFVANQGSSTVTELQM
ncbi:MAG TPA: hypothetical protein VFN61_09475, partial [Acidimicrobiales bacterium]|nr:hypothetical protein [Acidimicrobiales bacterium]